MLAFASIFLSSLGITQVVFADNALTAQSTNTTTSTANLPNGAVLSASSPPTGLTAAAVPPSQINLSWNAPSSNGGSPITGYKIYRSTSSGTETLLGPAGNLTTYSDTGLASGTTYFYKVTAVNAIGESAQSNEASATITSTPSAPQGLSAAAVSSSQINLGWTAPSNNGGTPITGYRIERSIDSGTVWSTIASNTGSTATAYSDTGLAANTTYTYRVSAVNSVGTSTPSNTASATTSDTTTNKTKIIFHDDYTSSTGWTQVGTQITVDSSQFPNMVKFNNVVGGGGVTEERVYKQLPTTLPAYNWVLETTYMFTASSIPVAYPVVLTTDSSNPEITSSGTPAPNIRIFHGYDTNQLSIDATGNMSSAIPISPNMQYFLRLERTHTQLVLYAFSDPARTQQVPGSPVTMSFNSTALPNLDFIQHSGSRSAGPARTLTGQVTNTTIYVTNLPNGTIFSIPSSPTSLTATPALPSQINLSWSAPSSNGGSPITGYKIYRSTSPGTETLLSTIGNVTSYNDAGLTKGTTYYYKVSAVNSVGESFQSNEASAVITDAPSAPQSLTAAVVSSSQIYLSWNAPSSNGGSAITGYKIERSQNGGITWNTNVANTGSAYTKYMDGNLTGSTTYTYRVSAVNSMGSGPASNTASATTNSNIPPPPSNQTGVIFHDDYTSSTGWTQVGTQITVDSSQFPNMVKFNNVVGGGGVTEERVYKQLPTTLPAYNWVLETTYMFTASSIPVAYPVVLTTDSSNPEVIASGVSAPNIRVIQGYDMNQLAIQAIGAISPAIPISPNTPYYLKLERSQTSLILGVYSDPARTQQVPGSPVTMSFDPTALHNLSFIQHSGSLSAGPARTLTGQATNTTIYVVSSLDTVPQPPTGLTATAVSSSQINLSWNAPSNVGSPITGYKIERSNGATWSTIAPNTGSTATTYSDTGLSPSTTYTYRVSAINSAGTSTASNTASATTNPPPPPPNGTSIIFQDNYSSNSGWAQIGSEITANSAQFPGVAYFNNAAGGGGVTEERIVKQLPSTLPSRWTADFDYKFTASSIPAHMIFALTNTSVDPQSQSSTNRVFVEHGIGTNQLFVEGGSSGTTSSSIPISQNIQYHVRLDKTPTQLTLNVFSDASRTVQVPGSPVSIAISPTDYSNNLNYIQHDGCRDCGSARTLTAQVDNTRIYSTPVSPTAPSAPGYSTIFSDQYSTNAGWTQVGTEVNVSSGHAAINGIDGSDHRIYKSLGATLSNTTAFKLNFDFVFTAATNPADYIASLTSNTNNPDSSNMLGVGLGINGNNLVINYNMAPNLAHFSSSNIPLSTNTQYYVTLERVNSTFAKLSAYTDTARTIQASGSPIYQAIPGGLTGLSTIQHAVDPTGCTCRSLTGYVDNTSVVSDSGLAAAAISPSQINLSWSAPTNNGGSPITGYKIYRSTSSGTETLLATIGNVTSYSDTGLASGTTYFYKVSALNSVGESAPTNEASATPSANGIVLNNVQSTSGTTSSSNAITLASFNPSISNNRLLVVGVSANDNNVASVTFDGTPLRMMVSSFYNNDAEFWYLKNPTGIGDVVVTMNGPTHAVVGAYSFSGVNQTVSIPTHVESHSTTPSNPAISITTKYPNDWVLDLPSIYGSSTLGSPTCTQQWDANIPNQITGSSSTTTVSLPEPVTCRWTASGSGDLWDDVAIELKAY